MAALATSFLFALAMNHPFAQGNKRTAFIAAVMFMQLNGWMLTIADTELIGKLIVLVINRQLSQDDFVAFLQPCMAPCHEWPETSDYFD